MSVLFRALRAIDRFFNAEDAPRVTINRASYEAHGVARYDVIIGGKEYEVRQVNSQDPSLTYRNPRNGITTYNDIIPYDDLEALKNALLRFKKRLPGALSWAVRRDGPGAIVRTGTTEGTAPVATLSASDHPRHVRGSWGFVAEDWQGDNKADFLRFTISEETGSGETPSGEMGLVASPEVGVVIAAGVYDGVRFTPDPSRAGVETLLSQADALFAEKE